MASLQDRIISVFVDKRKRVLKESEVTNELNSQGIPCSNEDIRRHVQSLSPALFQLIFNTDRTVTIRVEPKIEICEEFLGNRCKSEAKKCEKLHICRHMGGNCPTPNCRFSHDFTRGYNRKIVTDHQCQHIDPVVLVKLLRIKEFPPRRPPNRRHRGGPGRNLRGRGRNFGSLQSLNSVSIQKDIDRHVDVSFPSSNLTKQIDMEITEMCLKLRDIKVEDKFDENENDYCHRGTMQLQRLNDVEKLLKSPIIDHNGIPIKFKRTKQIIDKTSFMLKTSINNEQDKIQPDRFNLYVSTLVDRNLIDKITDISSDNEQIMIVQCKGEIDFLKICEGNQSRRKLAGKDITFLKIYECDTLEIHYNDQHKSINENDLKDIFRSAWINVFSYNFPSENSAEIEFIHNIAFKQWMLTKDITENKFNIKMTPLIDYVDENNDDLRSNVSSEFDIRPQATTNKLRSIVSNEYDTRPQATTIKLALQWAIIANHPKFKIEYKDFIRNEFGGEINIKDDEVTYTGNFPRHIRGPSNEVIFGNKTNEFMKKFEYKTFTNLEQHHIDFLQANSTNVAYSRTNENNYMVATKLHEMQGFQRNLFPKRNQYVQPKETFRPFNPPSNDRQDSFSSTSSATSTSVFPIINSEGKSMFTIGTFEDRLRKYLEETFNIKTIFERYANEKAKGAKTGIRIKLIGQMNDVDNATIDLQNLFSSLCTKKFDDENDGNWTKIREATEIIQYHFNRSDMICTCQQLSPTIVCVYYFDITNPQFGTDEQKIEDLIKDQFRSATIPFNQQSVLSQFTKDWKNLEENICKRDDYKKNICLYKESNNTYLFGLPDLVKEFRQKFEQLKHKYDPQACQITLSEKQLNYLRHVAKADMIKLEKQYKSSGCDVSLARLSESNEFLAPPDMHSRIKESIEALAQIHDISFDVNEPGFEALVSKNPERLTTLVKSKCVLEKRVEAVRVQIPIPKARVADFEDGINQTQTASATASAPSNPSSVNIGHSTVTILFGDLTTQPVDAIVACSSSGILCQKITRAAGPQVLQEYAQLHSSDRFPGTTSGGSLPCKKIIFVPWSPNSRSIADIKASLSTFIASAFLYATEEKYKSIAFPAVGCGQFNYDPSIIAKYLLREIQNQLKLCKTKMNISFVLLADQKNVYDAFVQRLNEMQTVDLAVSPKNPPRKNDDQSTIAYDKKIVKITLISSNDNDLIKCKEEILKLARSCSVKSQTIKQDMLDWSQNTIYKYYEYCLKQRVIPTLDLATTTLELVGAKDAVHEAETYFYELTNETLKVARMHAVAQGVIWSVELAPNSDTWEQYSYKLNGIIEDARLKGHPYVDFENDKEENCQINFSQMEETCKERLRRVRRKLVDSTLPRTWEPSDQNCKRVILPSTSPEYQSAFTQFKATMVGKYSQIIKIERIQNERWYKQYAAHRDDFQRRYAQADERVLFHGCPSASADEIIKACFNRSFAGVNGVLYGHGVYFHAQASYSHSYAPANSAGERTMFLVRVLIGKTCKGDKTMKVVPPGYDTTTDGQHIFVVYHDAGAYAEHLITYK